MLSGLKYRTIEDNVTIMKDALLMEIQINRADMEVERYIGALDDLDLIASILKGDFENDADMQNFKYSIARKLDLNVSRLEELSQGEDTEGVVSAIMGAIKSFVVMVIKFLKKILLLDGGSGGGGSSEKAKKVLSILDELSTKNMNDKSLAKLFIIILAEDTYQKEALNSIKFNKEYFKSCKDLIDDILDKGDLDGNKLKQIRSVKVDTNSDGDNQGMVVLKCRTDLKCDGDKCSFEIDMGGLMFLMDSNYRITKISSFSRTHAPEDSQISISDYLKDEANLKPSLAAAKVYFRVLHNLAKGKFVDTLLKSGEDYEKRINKLSTDNAVSDYPALYASWSDMLGVDVPNLDDESKEKHIEKFIVFVGSLLKAGVVLTLDNGKNIKIMHAIRDKFTAHTKK